MIYVFFVVGLAAAVGLIYALHQLGLHLERLGYLYYWRTKPSGGGSSMFAPVQELTQPQIKHVVEVNDESRLTEEEAAGDGVNKPERTS